MIPLDTDHVSLLKYPASERGARRIERLNALPVGEVVAVSIVGVEEQMRGWLAAIAKERLAKRQITAYRELAKLFEFFAEFTIAFLDESAAEQFDQLRSAEIRIGTMDLNPKLWARAAEILRQLPAARVGPQPITAAAAADQTDRRAKSLAS